MDGREDEPGEERDESRRAARARIQHQATWVDLQLRRAMERGEFDDLPGYGKPIEDLSEKHDPDWWVKRLLEREQVTGVLPPSLQLRKEDAELDERLDRITREADVRREVEEFNGRVRWALYRPPEGPPMVTPQRDADVEVDRWRARRQKRLAAHLAARENREQPERRKVRRWWQPRRP